MKAIIEADRDDLGHPTDAGAEPRRARDERQGCQIERAQPIECGRHERLAVDVADCTGEVADLAVAIEHAGFFLTGWAIAQELHRDLSFICQ